MNRHYAALLEGLPRVVAAPYKTLLPGDEVVVFSSTDHPMYVRVISLTPLKDDGFFDLQLEGGRYVIHGDQYTGMRRQTMTTLIKEESRVIEQPDSSGKRLADYAESKGARQVEARYLTVHDILFINTVDGIHTVEVLSVELRAGHYRKVFHSPIPGRSNPNPSLMYHRYQQVWTLRP